jgi:alkylation response protein AidB-like acyl-CoA dehydrogenase
VRPLYQITGEAEFNEVFLTDVRIPGDAMLGREGEGWKVAIATLMNERVAIGGSTGGTGFSPTDALLDLWRERIAARSPGAPLSPREAVLRDRITQLWIEAQLLRLTNQRARAAMRSGIPGPEGSVGKLMMAELNKKVYDACLDVLDAGGLLYEPGYALRRPERGAASSRTAALQHAFLRARANSIEGGTSEIMRNILGERVLGLPGDVRVDKDVAWSEVPRNG